MRKITASLGLSLILLVAAVGATAQTPVRVPGYLAGERLPEAARLLPPPPAEGSERQLQELALFRTSRGLNGTPRWTMAQGDNDYSPPALMQHFSCSLGVSLDSQSAPRLARLLGRMTVDAGGSAVTAKQVFARKRPYLLADGDICIAKSQSLADSPDYPSGHASLGWAAGMILAELAPERAAPIMLRARAFGDSRVVCGVHTPSAVEAGRDTAAAVFAALHGSDEFRADVEAARAEIAAARAAGKSPAPAACATEAALIAKPPF